MSMVIVRCPACGVDLSLNNENDHLICNRCRSKINVREAIGSVNEDVIRIWMKLGLAASRSGNQHDANEFFSRVVEVDPDNWMAIFLKGRSAAAQSTIETPRIQELIKAITKACGILREQKISQPELINAKNLFAVSLTHWVDAFSLLHKKRLERAETLFLDLHWELMGENRLWCEKAIVYYQFAMALINGLKDEKSNANRLELKKKIALKCVAICDFELYYKDYGKKYQAIFGYSAQEKQPYIDLYDQMIGEIRIKEPHFRINEEQYIDRLDPPKANFAPGYLESRTRVLKKLEHYANQRGDEKTSQLTHLPFGVVQTEGESSCLPQREINENVNPSKFSFSVFQEV